MFEVWRAKRKLNKRVKQMEKRTRQLQAIAEAVNRMNDILTREGG